MPAKRKTGKPQERDREELSEIESQDEDQEEMNSTICNRNDEPEIIEDTRVEYRPIAESREAGNAPILTENFEFNRTSNQGIPRPGMRYSLAACGDNTTSIQAVQQYEKIFHRKDDILKKRKDSNKYKQRVQKYYILTETLNLKDFAVHFLLIQEMMVTEMRGSKCHI